MGTVDEGKQTGRVAALGRAEGTRFLRFCCVGGVGFGVDALLLMGLVHLLGLDPIPARTVSAAFAILATFELNRRWAFRGIGSARYGAALAAYGGVQSVGLACNFAVYTGCYLLLPLPLRESPGALLACVAMGSATALALNYAGASRVVFRAAAS